MGAKGYLPGKLWCKKRGSVCYLEIYHLQNYVYR
jgi:hypothetical protein